MCYVLWSRIELCVLVARVRRRHNTTYVFQVGVAPHFAVGEHARHDPALLIDIRPLAHGPALQPRQAPVEEIGHVDSGQAAAGQPQEGPAQLVVNDAQREFPVVVVDLLRADVPVVVDGQQIPAVHLGKERRPHSVRGGHAVPLDLQRENRMHNRGILGEKCRIPVNWLLLSTW